MKKSGIKTIFILCLLVCLPGCGDSPQLPELSENASILAFGDSLTYGYGVNKDQSYPAILEQLSGRRVINAGISGEESASGVQRLPILLEKHDPELMILCHGGNDILRQRSMDKMADNLATMIRMAVDNNIPVVLLGVPKPGLFLSAADVYREIAEQSGVIYIDDLIPEILSNTSMKSDTVHPNAAGYQAMAEHIHEILDTAGAY